MPLTKGETLGVWMNLLQVNQVIQNALEQRLEESADLSLAEFEVLARLSSAPERRLKMIDIANLLLVSKSGITRIVDRLEQAGLVKREVPPENRRIVYTRMLPVGLEVFGHAQTIFKDAVEDTFSQHLSDGDVQALREVLHKLLVGHRVWEEERCTFKLDATRMTASPSSA